MPQAAVLAQPPAVQLPAGRDGGAVGAATRDVPNTLGLQGLDQPRLVTVPGRETPSQQLIRLHANTANITLHPPHLYSLI